eukprot:m.496960 g.496960  ORF g.496960 m.496960 type:complete len:621 (+) comp21810_c0_seq4:385-2247(+)
MHRIRTTMEYIFVPPKNHKLPGWPIYMDHDHDAPVLGMLRQKDPIAVTKIHDIWLHVRQHNGPIGWSPGVAGNAQVLVPINSPQAQRYFQQQMRPQSITSAAEPMSYRELQKHQQKRQQVPPPKRPTSYGWQRARGKSKNYGEVLEKRRHQLRQVDLSEHPALLEEWYELIKELDTVFRYGFRSAITPQPKGTGRKRSYSFLDLFKPSTDAANGVPGTPGGPGHGSAAPTPTRRKSRSSSFTGLFSGAATPPPPAHRPHRDTASQKLVSNAVRPPAPSREAARQAALKVLLRENAARRVARHRDNVTPVQDTVEAPRLPQEPGMAAVSGSPDTPTHDTYPPTHESYPPTQPGSHPETPSSTSMTRGTRTISPEQAMPQQAPGSTMIPSPDQVPPAASPSTRHVRAGQNASARPQLLVSADEFDSPREITSTDIEHLVAHQRHSGEQVTTPANTISTTPLTRADNPTPTTPEQAVPLPSVTLSSPPNPVSTSRIPAPSAAGSTTPHVALRSQDEDAHARRVRVAQGLARIRAAAGGGAAARLPEHEAYLQSLVKLADSGASVPPIGDKIARVLAFENADAREQREQESRQLEEFEAAEAAVSSPPAAASMTPDAGTVLMNF